jgi:hypothetical protein
MDKAQNIFSILLFCICVQTVSAQTRISVQGASVLPTAELQDAADVGFGGCLNISTPVYYSNLEAVLSAGYYLCGYKENLPDYKFSFTTAPLLLGLRWNFTDVDFIPYAAFYGGVFFNTYRLEIDDKVFGLYTARTVDRHLGFAGELGFRMNLNPDFDIEVCARYNHLKNKYIARSFVEIQSGVDVRF